MPSTRDHRRVLLPAAISATLVAGCALRGEPPPQSALQADLAALEHEGRLGVAVFDTGTGAIDGRRLDERFAMCSTFKLVLAAMVLQRGVDARSAPATAMLRDADLVSHSPITRQLVADATARGERSAAVDLRTLAHAAQTRSDGTAANLLLRAFGGPSGFGAFCRANGDTTSRLDRYEPEMNDVQPGDVRDTTTPRAMAHLVGRLLGPVGLDATARATLRGWMIETETGAQRVRAGLPKDWIAGDKTGTGGGTKCTVKVNDVVWIEPPGRAPLVVAVYYDTTTVADWPSDAQQAVLAEVGRVVVRQFAPTPDRGRP